MKFIPLTVSVLIATIWNPVDLTLNAFQLEGVVQSPIFQTQGSLLASQSPPPPDPPRPSGDLPGVSCDVSPENLELPMITIRPNGSEKGVTASATPTLLFYIPYNSATIESGEFTILSHERRNGRKIFSTELELPSSPGIVSFTLPQSEMGDPYLEEGKYYRWYFSIVCLTETGEPLERTLRGWIRRLEPSEVSDDQRFYYDELAEAFSGMENGSDHRQWFDLLQEFELEEYAEVIMTGPVNPILESDS